MFECSSCAKGCKAYMTKGAWGRARRHRRQMSIDGLIAISFCLQAFPPHQNGPQFRTKSYTDQQVATITSPRAGLKRSRYCFSQCAVKFSTEHAKAPHSVLLSKPCRGIVLGDRRHPARYSHR